VERKREKARGRGGERFKRERWERGIVRKGRGQGFWRIEED